AVVLYNELVFLFIIWLKDILLNPRVLFWSNIACLSLKFGLRGLEFLSATDIVEACGCGSGESCSWVQVVGVLRWVWDGGVCGACVGWVCEWCVRVWVIPQLLLFVGLLLLFVCAAYLFLPFSFPPLPLASFLLFSLSTQPLPPYLLSPLLPFSSTLLSGI
ncbi:hypothetical protein U1Q18_001195, partial [Sarracenia purpurea var. burkii]